MIANINYVHLRSGGVLSFRCHSGRRRFAAAICNGNWPWLLGIGATGNVTLGNCIHCTWIGQTELCEWLNSLDRVHRLPIKAKAGAA